MAWKFFSPNSKRKHYEQQLKTGVNSSGEALSDLDAAYRKGYNRAVRDQNRIFAYKNATPEQRAAYKASRRKKKKKRK